MTENDKTEIAYLCELLSAASMRHVAEDEDALRVEIDARISRILDGDAPSAPDNPVDEPLTTGDFKALEAAKLNDYLDKRKVATKAAKDKYKEGRVRVSINGKFVWKLKSECRQVPRFPDCPKSTAWKWEWVGPQPEVDKLSDDLWKEHEEAKND